MRREQPQSQNQSILGRAPTGVLALVWVVTMYIPDPLPWVDEIGIPIILMQSEKGRLWLGLAVLGVVGLTLIGLPPIGLLS